MQKGTVLLIVFIGLVVVVIWVIIHRPSSKLKYQDLTKRDPYEYIARQTGGQVFRFDKESVGSPAATSALLRTVKEREFPFLFVAEGVPGMGGTRFPVLVDSSVKALSIEVSAAEGQPRISALDPSNHEAPLEVTPEGKGAIHVQIGK